MNKEAQASLSGQGWRLGHVITTPTNQKGAGWRTLQDARLASSLGFNTDIITGWGIQTAQQAQVNTSGANYIRVHSLNKYIYPHKDLQALVALYRLFRRKKYHVVHTHLAKAGILGRLAAGLAGIPLIVHSVHGPSFWPTQPFWRRHLYIFLERLAGYFTTHYIFWAHHLLETYAAQGIGSRARKVVIYPCGDFSPFLKAAKAPEEQVSLRRQWGLGPEDLVAGYVARLVPAKGHELAIRACEALRGRYPHLRLMLVGGAVWPEEEKCLQNLKALVKELHMENMVLFTGYQNDVARYYRLFDVYLFPSLYEALGGTMLEAFVAGAPVVAFDLPGAREEGLGEEAVFVPCYDLEALTTGLAKTLDNVKDYSQNNLKRERQRTKILEQWSHERWQRNLQQFYGGLVQDLYSPGKQIPSGPQPK